MRELSLHMTDIAQNALAAGATRIRLKVDIDCRRDIIKTSVEDNGCGMDEQTLNHCTDPFMTTRASRRIGLGLALYKLSAEQSGGSFSIKSKLGRGTGVYADYVISCVDRAPLGSMAETVAALAAANPQTEFELEYTAEGRGFTFIANTPHGGGAALAAADIQKQIQQRIDEINGGAEPI